MPPASLLSDNLTAPPPLYLPPWNKTNPLRWTAISFPLSVSASSYMGFWPATLAALILFPAMMAISHSRLSRKATPSGLKTPNKSRSKHLEPSTLLARRGGENKPLVTHTTKKHLLADSKTSRPSHHRTQLITGSQTLPPLPPIPLSQIQTRPTLLYCIGAYLACCCPPWHGSTSPSPSPTSPLYAFLLRLYTVSPSAGQQAKSVSPPALP
jgi:hypothetical protein